MNPWAYFSLESATATERELKSAYARLLKQHRPDQDPEGFQKLRQHYEAALAWLHRPQEEPQQESAQPEPEAAQPAAERIAEPEPIHLPAGFAPLLPPLLEARDRGLPLRPHLDYMLTTAEEQKLPAALLSSLLGRLFGGMTQALADGLSGAFLLFCMKQGEMDLPHATVSAWQNEEPVPLRVISLATLLTQQLPLLKDQDAAYTLAKVASVVALHRPDLATPLLNAAAPELPRQHREQILSQVESDIQLGQLFHGFPSELKRFWLQQILQRPDTDWDSALVKEAVKYVVEIRGHSWPGIELVKSVLPEQVRAGFTYQLSQQRSADRVAAPVKRGFSLNGWVIWGLFMICLNVVKFCNKTTEQARPEQRYERRVEPSKPKREESAQPSPATDRNNKYFNPFDTRQNEIILSR